MDHYSPGDYSAVNPGTAVLGTTADVWHTEVQSEKERELLFAGHQFRTAIGLYYKDHAGYPPTLEDLLKDSQQASTRRYLPKISRPRERRKRMGTAADNGRRHHGRA